MDHIKLLRTEINIQELMDLVASPSCGATSMFVGTTRDNFDGKVVKQLVYEAYDSMAEKALQKLCADIRSRWKVHGIAMYHRLGECPVKHASVAIAISSEHRAESLLAVQYAIDKLKADVPIWKKEEYEGNVPPQWKENAESAWIKTEAQDSSAEDNMVSDEDCQKEKDLSRDSVQMAVDVVVPLELIQVTADDVELKRRMDAFMEFKRNQVNESNIREFCRQADSEFSCARVDALICRTKDSKGHLRVRRVENMSGPMTWGIEKAQGGLLSPLKSSLVKREKHNPEVGSCKFTGPTAIEERLRNAELRLGLGDRDVIRPVPKDVYARLKVLEDRILYLEGVSPEYSNVLTEVPKIELQETKPKLFKKKSYTIADLDQKMRELEQSMREDS